MSKARRLACLLTAHAGWVLPPGRTRWAAAMEREVHHIDADRQALSWASGCVFAAYAARARAEFFFLPWLLRFSLAAYCALRGYNKLSGSWSGFECRLAQAAGEQLDIACLWRVMGIPQEVYFLWFAAGGLFVLTALRLLLNRADVFRVFAFGVLLDAATMAWPRTPPILLWADLPFSAYNFYAVSPLSWVLPLCLAGAIFCLDHYRALRRQAEKWA